METIEKSSTIRQLHQFTSVLLTKFNSEEIMSSIDGKGFQELVKDPERLFYEFQLFASSGGMPLSSHVIDCSQDVFRPLCIGGPENFQLERFVPHVDFSWDPLKIKLMSVSELLTACISDLGLLDGPAWITYLEISKGLRLSNCNILEYILDRKYLIPDDWKHTPILFLGSLYRQKHLNQVNAFYLYHNHNMFSRSHVCIEKIDIQRHSAQGLLSNGCLFRNAKIAVFEE